MINAIDAAEDIRLLLTQLLQQQMSTSARSALAEDLKYIEIAIRVLKTGDPNAIDDLWREAQYLSRFFGGDYAVGEDKRRLIKLCNIFQDALLDRVSEIRSL